MVVLRILSILLIGYILYSLLIWLLTWIDEGTLRRKNYHVKKASKKNHSLSKEKLIRLYLTILLFIVTLSFIMIKNYIRGV